MSSFQLRSITPTQTVSRFIIYPVNMRIVGLTGGIATGKTMVSGLIQLTGIPIIDCDRIARQVVQPGRWGWNRVVHAFGRDVLLPNEDIDRALLSRLVFEDERSRKKLNKATHLPIFIELGKQIFLAWLRCETVVVVDMPLLFETGAERWFYPIVLIWCDEETQIKRLMQRDKCNEDEAKLKVAAQMPLIEKSEKSTVIIDNSSPVACTAIEVNALSLQLRREQLSSYFVSPIALIAYLLIGVFFVMYTR